MMAGYSPSRLDDIARRMNNNFRRYFMPRDARWNRMGHKLPLWFRLAIRRIDRRLCLQFIPPKSKVGKNGVSDAQFPHGVWYICSKLKNNPRWLGKRAVYVLVDEDGKPTMPDRDLLKLLRFQKQARKTVGANVLEDAFTKAAVNLDKAESRRSREALYSAVVQTMRRLNICSFAQPRVYMPHR